MADPGAIVHMDPRRPGRSLLAVWCWCGRFYTTTLPEARRRQAEGRPLCPDPACGQGAE